MLKAAGTAIPPAFLPCRLTGNGIEQVPGTAGLTAAVASGAAPAPAAAPLTTTASGYIDPDSSHDPEGQGTAGEAVLDWALPPGADEEPVPACLLCPEARESGLLFLGTGSAEPSKYRCMGIVVGATFQGRVGGMGRDVAVVGHG